MDRRTQDQRLFILSTRSMILEIHLGLRISIEDICGTGDAGGSTTNEWLVDWEDKDGAHKTGYGFFPMFSFELPSLTSGHELVEKHWRNGGGL